MLSIIDLTKFLATVQKADQPRSGSAEGPQRKPPRKQIEALEVLESH